MYARASTAATGAALADAPRTSGSGRTPAPRTSSSPGGGPWPLSPACRRSCSGWRSRRRSGPKTRRFSGRASLRPALAVVAYVFVFLWFRGELGEGGETARRVRSCHASRGLSAAAGANQPTVIVYVHEGTIPGIVHLKTTHEREKERARRVKLVGRFLEARIEGRVVSLRPTPTTQGQPPRQTTAT